MKRDYIKYLKCNNCGFLNEVNTEYQIFCVNCKKKLENNFTAWNIKNQKSFLEFKKEVCTSKENIETDRPKKTYLT